jgi:hypothetical protein
MRLMDMMMGWIGARKALMFAGTRNTTIILSNTLPPSSLSQSIPSSPSHIATAYQSRQRLSLSKSNGSLRLAQLSPLNAYAEAESSLCLNGGARWFTSIKSFSVKSFLKPFGSPRLSSLLLLPPRSLSAFEFVPVAKGSGKESNEGRGQFGTSWKISRC